MAKFLIMVLLLLLPLLGSRAEKQVFEVYIVYFGEHSGEKALHEIEETHHSYLVSVKSTEEEARASLLYSYKHSINGFAAVLSPDEVSKLSEMEDVMSVFRSGEYTIHTTRSWEFVGLLMQEEEHTIPTHFKKLGSDLLSRAKYGQDVVVGVIDTGVWPESQSFSDKGMGPIPKSWKGICQSGPAFNSSHCNRKIIGARYFIKEFEHHYGPLNASEDYRSSRDKNGHGTHTASTVGGRMVHNVSVNGGFGRGIASGGAPLVRLAIYKVCWQFNGKSLSCSGADIMAAIDAAVADGVHVMSISLGTRGQRHEKYYTDDIFVIGALHASRNNIVVACSAGNDGPTPSTVSHIAPWIITVAASSVDRKFVSPVVLGNGSKIKGQSATPSKLEKKMYPLVYAADVADQDVSKDYAVQCLPHSLSLDKVKGKIVLCMIEYTSVHGEDMEVKRAGGAGYILGSSRAGGVDELAAHANVLPATVVVYTDAIRILEYINSTKNPIATIIPAKTVLHTKPAPFMAAFSSRGPNTIDPNIIKPDITAPGLNIIAAWTPENSPSANRAKVEYHMISGTSMSCPHVAAAAALVKAIHPTWSSAAIRSAIMTTASVINNNGLPLTNDRGNVATPFAYGSGHFQPTKAADPGLVYDASYYDYLLYLCSLGSVKKFDKTFKCPKAPPSSFNLNYPSLAVSKLNGTVSVKRTVTNVGGGGKSIYFFTSQPPVGMSVRAHPSILVFDRVGQKKSFTITLRAISDEILRKKDGYGFGWYKWTDAHALHVVRSPIAVSLA
ncbi:subtilisin-like protease SBT5.6 isoform X2 [Ziziphus jujuba]|uniref:Subtilisin-like protease SBT5.6 isoform X2 n=1 Tax=Ziziphus jujuba TaxID=326968 RepID=A0ABM3IPF9_ZIZJJ|nr:subtilisin-like protease SBT5.6 isoform X2 [Ziziphus jujuba]